MKAHMQKLTVALNGTDVNPFAIHGLTQNPFPQIAKAELMGAMNSLNKLGGPPIPHDTYEAYIRDVLKGWSEEFVAGCVARFKPGEMVKFEVTFPA